MKTRRLLRFGLIGAVTALYAAAQPGYAAAAAEQDAARAARARAAARKRRIIYNDDGDAQYGDFNPAAGSGIDGFLGERFRPVLGTQVDTYFWCVGNGEDPAWGKAPPPVLDDPTRIMVEAAHDADIEIFGSLRMNDIHDAWAPKLTYPLKVQRPDLLIGTAAAKPYPKDALLRAFWSAFDYAHPEVRDHRYEYIVRTATRYDFDGFELDFFRHPLFFKPGEEQANLATMTGFVARVRQGLDRIAAARGRPYLLAVRVPAGVAQALRTGLDVEAWLRQDLIDLLIPNPGYQPYTAAYADFIELGHRYNVPVYPCFNCSAMSIRTTGSQQESRLMLRSVTSSFWGLGADGVYLFNFFVPWQKNIARADEWDPDTAHTWLREIGDPDTLAGLEKRYRTDHGCNVFYIGYGNAPNPFPVALIPGTPIQVVVGDDVRSAAGGGRKPELRLTVKVAALGAQEGIRIRVNGGVVPQEAVARAAADRFEARLTAPPLRQGINQVVVLPGPGTVGRLASAVTDLEVSVRYTDESQK